MAFLTQWENENTGSAFPLKDDAVPPGLPMGALVDACFVVPTAGAHGTVSDLVSLECLYVGERIASATFTANGVALLAADILLSEYAPFSPVVMKSSLPGYLGFVTFGDLSTCARGVFRGPIPVSESAVVRVFPGRLRSLVRPDMASELRGDVVVDLPDGISSAVEERGNGVSVLRFSASDDVKAEMRGPCENPSGKESMPVPISRINGVAPDKYGRIAVVFTG